MLPWIFSIPNGHVRFNSRRHNVRLCWSSINAENFRWWPNFSRNECFLSSADCWYDSFISSRCTGGPLVVKKTQVFQLLVHAGGRRYFNSANLHDNRRFLIIRLSSSTVSDEKGILYMNLWLRACCIEWFSLAPPFDIYCVLHDAVLHSECFEFVTIFAF